MKRLTQREVAIRRVVEHIDISGGKGVIRAAGKQFELRFDDLLDLVQAVEIIMLKLTGKVLSKPFRPRVADRSALKIISIVAGDYSLGPTPAPVPHFTPCEVTEQILKAHYLRVELGGGEVWENWFCRLDELVKCLCGVISDVQSPAPVVTSQRAPKQTHFVGSAAVH